MFRKFLDLNSLHLVFTLERKREILVLIIMESSLPENSDNLTIESQQT